MDKKTKLSLVIPCYNEEKTLWDCVTRCLELQKHGIDLELVIVDDCSTDNSLAVARGLAEEYPSVFLVAHEVNRGKGAALRTGFLQAHGDYIGIQDADAEYDPLDYLTMLEPLTAGKADVVYGSRYLRPDTRRVLYFWHTWMNRSLTFISNMFTNLDITDMETCYKLFRRDIILSIAKELKEDRFGFEPEVTSHVARKRCRVYECAIHYSPRTYEEGKKIGWKDGVRALYCILHYGAHDAPLPMQLLLYFFIGLTCALTNILAFSIFISSCTLLPSVVLSFVIAAALNYLLCILILFRHKARWSSAGELTTYILAVLFMCALDYGMTTLFLYSGMSAVGSKALASVVGFIGNFLLRKYCVF